MQAVLRRVDGWMEGALDEHRQQQQQGRSQQQQQQETQRQQRGGSLADDEYDDCEDGLHQGLHDSRGIATGGPDPAEGGSFSALQAWQEALASSLQVAVSSRSGSIPADGELPSQGFGPARPFETPVPATALCGGGGGDDDGGIFLGPVLPLVRALMSSLSICYELGGSHEFSVHSEGGETVGVLGTLLVSALSTSGGYPSSTLPAGTISTFTSRSTAGSASVALNDGIRRSSTVQSAPDRRREATCARMALLSLYADALTTWPEGPRAELMAAVARGAKASLAAAAEAAEAAAGSSGLLSGGGGRGERRQQAAAAAYLPAPVRSTRDPRSAMRYATPPPLPLPSSAAEGGTALISAASKNALAAAAAMSSSWERVPPGACLSFALELLGLHRCLAMHGLGGSSPAVDAPEPPQPGTSGRSGGSAHSLVPTPAHAPAIAGGGTGAGQEEGTQGPAPGQQFFMLVKKSRSVRSCLGGDWGGGFHLSRARVGVSTG